MENKIEDTFAECFSMSFVRLVVTATDEKWLETAAREFCGYGTSVIACDAECGIEGSIEKVFAPDGRRGLSILAFGFSADQLANAVATRTGQCLMTCPTTAVFNGYESENRVDLGSHLRYFGDGYQKSKKLGERRFWRIPVMDGEFVVEDVIGVGQGIAGGNFIIQSPEQSSCLTAAEAAVAAIASIEGCITPFPGGVARSGSKVGSRYKNLRASTSEVFCPTLMGRVATKLHPEAGCAYEIVIDAIDESTVRTAMRAGIDAALDSKAGEKVVAISAGNYGGKLGKCQIDLTSLYEIPPDVKVHDAST